MTDLYLLGLIASSGVLSIAMVLYILNKKRAGYDFFNAYSSKDFASTMRAAGAQPVKGGFLISRDEASYRFELKGDTDGLTCILSSRTLTPSLAPGALPELPVMRLRQENDRDRLGKILRLNREVQTGDARFDARIYVECDAARGAGSAVLASPEVRQGVTGLLALGYREVCLRRYQSTLVAYWTLGMQEFTTDTVDQTIRRLASIGDNLPAFRKTPTSTPMSTGLWVVIATCVLAAAMFWFFAIADRNWRPIGNGLDFMTIQLAFLLLLLHTAAVWVVLRGHSLALRHLSLSFFAGVCMVSMASRGALVLYNGSGDPNITTHERVLDHKRMVKNDNSTRHYFYFPSVPGVADSSIRLKVSSSRYSAASKGDTFLVTVGAGNLGTPWLLELERRDQ